MSFETRMRRVRIARLLGASAFLPGMVATLVIVAACATPPAITRVDTRDVVVTKIERPLTEQQIRETVPPAPMGRRPDALSAALDFAIAKLCEYVAYAERADPMLQHSAGVAITQRVREPVCQR